jgi:type I restriction enzyme S subunit
MELKPGYKQTEVGVIPEEWDVRPLSNISLKIMVGIASAATHAYRLSGIPMIRNQNIKPGHLLDSDLLFIDQEYEKTYRNKRLLEGDLLTTRTGYPGTTCIVPAKYKAAQSFTTLITRPDTAQITSKFLCLYINSEHGQRFFESSQIGGAQKNVNTGTLKKMPIPMPTVSEQTKVSNVLGAVEELLASIEDLIAKKRALKQAAMQELLTGKRRLGVFEGEWEVKRLGDVAHIKTGSKNNEDKVEDGEYPFFVRSDNVERIGSYSYDCEAVLVPGEGRIGDVFHYIKGRFDVHQRVYAITQFAREVSGKFVHCYMAMNFGTWAMQNTVKATVDSLRLPTFQTFEMRVPPTKDEQDAIAGVLTEIDTELAALEARKDKAQMLKQGMMQQLLTGKVRLK